MIVKKFTFIVKVNCVNEFAEMLDNLVHETYQKENPIHFDYEIKYNRYFVVNEKWSNLDDFNKHQQSQHLKRFQNLRVNLIEKKIENK